MEGLIIALLVLGAAIFLGWYFLRKKGRASVLEVSPQQSSSPEGRLTRTKNGFVERLGNFLGRNPNDVSQSEWELIEEALLAGDVGITTTQKLLQLLKEKRSNGSDLKKRLIEGGSLLLSESEQGFDASLINAKPYVISIVGVNGVGKTTTIGKLGRFFSEQGKSVLFGAGDTFRAAAIDQLKIWSDRIRADFVTGREGADPGAVAFDAVSAAKSRGKDIVLLDTAGRLHTKSNLMDELVKINRVVKKVIPEAPHQTWLVLDGTAGQNSIVQAREFHKALALTGVIVTKLDGSAKGGAVLGVALELKLPIRFIGLGEGAEDLFPFRPTPFLEAIFG